jgi:hypothetical protein
MIKTQLKCMTTITGEPMQDDYMTGWLEDYKLTVFKCRQTATVVKPPCSTTECGMLRGQN